jgi:hypothetical protein
MYTILLVECGGELLGGECLAALRLASVDLIAANS